MTEEFSQQALPAKCSQCQRPMSTPIVCDSCRTLHPIPALADYYEMLGLEAKFDLDVEHLRSRFLAVSRSTHPDFHGGDDPEAQLLSLRLSAAINDAYRTLLDPVARAGYLLELLGGKSAAEEKSVPDGFLDSMMMLQEELADAKAEDDQATLEKLRTALDNQHDGILRRIGELFREFDESVACRALSEEKLARIRRQTNAISYVRKLQSQLPSRKDR
ncbi:MAG: Fe-S protein assembly co-chaperone HscB [Planctomycetota bacterium]